MKKTRCVKYLRLPGAEGFVFTAVEGNPVTRLLGTGIIRYIPAPFPLWFLPLLPLLERCGDTVFFDIRKYHAILFVRHVL